MSVPSRSTTATRDASSGRYLQVWTPGEPNAADALTGAIARLFAGIRERRVLDLFAGPGGWDIAAQALGLEPVGVELDRQACETRHVAGLRTLMADVAALDPLLFGVIWGLIASPPCQAFSAAGKGAGRAAIDAYIEAIGCMVRGEPVDVEALDELCGDPRAHLVLEPLRWALALRPAWIALEQVPAVLPIWQAMARALRTLGYDCWAGLLTSERYGVPQTRQRAILTASRVAAVLEAPATHQRYVAPRKRDEASEQMFAPEAERVVRPEDRDLEPWVSMEQALGWGLTARPANTVTATNGNGGPRPLDGGSGARKILSDAKESGEWASEPAPTIAGESRADRWVLVMGNQTNATVRGVDEPAPTVLFGHRVNDVQWCRDRPATTVACDPRIAAPGHKEAGERNQMDDTVRVTLEEAAVLQSFPVGYPWQGTKTQAFRQVGNAIPPLMAWHVLRSVAPDVTSDA